MRLAIYSCKDSPPKPGEVNPPGEVSYPGYERMACDVWHPGSAVMFPPSTDPNVSHITMSHLVAMTNAGEVIQSFNAWPDGVSADGVQQIGAEAWE